ncbi:MAG: sulfite exporter TauE/SafE family protein, partial [Alphaproteobacteria bacterium]|nr:sulfite exporter TauE/SafE family protein [Alphaproteobacteria bacterium]
YPSGIYLSPFAPLILGFVTGIATELMGVGGGFLLIPAKVYLFGMRSRVVAGTSLFQILFVTATATLVNALTTHTVDIVLAGLLLLGSVLGAQLGTRLASRTPPDYMRLALGLIILSVAVRMIIGLGIHPDAIYTVEIH